MYKKLLQIKRSHAKKFYMCIFFIFIFINANKLSPEIDERKPACGKRICRQKTEYVLAW